MPPQLLLPELFQPFRKNLTLLLMLVVLII